VPLERLTGADLMKLFPSPRIPEPTGEVGHGKPARSSKPRRASRKKAAAE
jgi:hypothetical protein